MLKFGEGCKKFLIRNSNTLMAVYLRGISKLLICKNVVLTFGGCGGEVA